MQPSEDNNAQENPPSHPPDPVEEEKHSTDEQSHSIHSHKMSQKQEEEAKLMSDAPPDAALDDLIQIVDATDCKDSADGPSVAKQNGEEVSLKGGKVNKVAPALIQAQTAENDKKITDMKKVVEVQTVRLSKEDYQKKWENIIYSSFWLIPWEKEGKNVVDGITEFTSPTDVYPIRIQINPKQLLKMKIIRFLIFLCCFYFVVPFDLYIHQHWRRIWLFETDYYKQTVVFEDYNSSLAANTFNYTFHLTNCKVYLQESTANITDHTMQFDLEYGFPFGTEFEFDESHLLIRASPNEMCIVRLYMSISSVIPKLIFNMTGTQDNILLQDNTRKYTSLRMEGGLQVFGEKVFMTLADHSISSLSVNLQYGIVVLEDIKCPSRLIQLQEGIYNDLLPSSTDDFSISAEQPEGNICLRGPYTKLSTTGKCDVIEKGYNDTSYQASGLYSCVIGAHICQNQTACNASTAKNQISAYVKDGQIQASIREKTMQQKYANISKKFESSVNLTLNSYKTLNESTQGFFNEPDISRVSKLQIIGASYQKTWLYTNKEVYFQAQYWPLIWASAGLLTPKMVQNKLLLIDNTCPARTPQASVDAQISSLIQSMHPKGESVDIAFTEGQTSFYRVIINSFGEAQYNQISIGENPLLIAAFALSAVIALLLTLFSLYLLYKFYKVLKRTYNEYVMKRKNLSITLSLVKDKNGSENEQEVGDNTVLQDVQVSHNQYEVRGVFSNRLENNQQDIKKYNLTFSFSLYQIPAMVIDHLFREQINSLSQFLMAIKEDASVLTKQKLKEEDQKKVSISMFSFQAIYSRYCNINGYKEIHNLDSEENKKLFKSFGMTIIDNDNMKEHAYANMRLKTLKEQSETIIDDEEYAQMSSVQQFLVQKCVPSQFKTDFLTFEQLKQEYEKFCRAEAIPLVKQIQIIGSPEIIEFGAIVDETNPPKNILGITTVENKKQSDQANNDLANIVRVPCSYRQSIIAYFISIDGIIPNTALPIVHFCLILIVPLVSPFISFYALTLLTTFQGDVFKKPISIFDFYYVNKMDPWWENVPSVDIVLYIHIYVLVYLFFAYSELFSYYLTGYQNNGKFAIQYTLARSIIMYAFYIGIFIFLFMYLLMAFFAIQWGILGAIFNPTVLLPYSAAIITFIATVGSKFAFYKGKVENLQVELEKIIKEKLGSLLIKSLEKIKKNMGDKYNSLMPSFNEKSTIEAIGNGINQALESDGTEKIDFKAEAKKFATNQLINNAQNIALLLSKQINGLDPAVIELIIAISINNEDGIKHSVDSLSSLLQIDGKIILNFVQLAIKQVKGDQEGDTQQMTTEIVQAVKQLFRALVQIDPVIQNVIGDICKVIIEGDPSPIVSLIKGQGKEIAGQEGDMAEEAIRELVTLVVKSLASNSKEDIKAKAIDFISQGYEQSGGKNQSAVDVMKMIESLRNGDLSPLTELQCYNGIDENSGLLGVNSAYAILFLLDFFRQSTSLSNEIIVCSMKEILMKFKLEDDSEANKQLIASQYNTSKQTYTFSEKMFLSLVSFARGNIIDLGAISKEVNSLKLDTPATQIDEEMMSHFCQISNSSFESLDRVVAKLGLQDKKELMRELCLFLKKREASSTEILKSLKIQSPVIKKHFSPIVKLIEALTEFDEQRFHWDDLEKKVKQYSEWLLYEKNGRPSDKQPLSDNPKKQQNELEAELDKLEEQQMALENKAYAKARSDLYWPLTYEIGFQVAITFKGIFTKLLNQEEFKDVEKEKYIHSLIDLRNRKTGNESMGRSQSRIIQKDDIESGKYGESEALLNGNKGKDYSAKSFLKGFEPNEKSLDGILEIFINYRCPQICLHKLFFLTIFAELHRVETKEKMDEHEQRQDIVRILMLSKYRVYFNGDMNEYMERNYLPLYLGWWMGLEGDGAQLLLDLIKGDPIRIFGFKEDKSKLEYNLNSKDGGASIAKQLKTDRLDTIKKIVKGSEKSLAQVFIRWYHQHRIIAVAEETIQQEYCNEFGLSHKFINMIKSKVHVMTNPKHEEENILLLRKSINSFLKSSLKQDKSEKKLTFQTPIADGQFNDKIDEAIKEQGESKQVPQFNDSEPPATPLISELHSLVSQIPDEQLTKILGLNNDSQIFRAHNLFRRYLTVGKSQDITDVLRLLSVASSIAFQETRLQSKQDFKEMLKKKREFIGMQVILNASKISQIQKYGIKNQTELKHEYMNFIDLYILIEPNNSGQGLVYSNGDEDNIISGMYKNGLLTEGAIKLLGPLFDTFKSKLPPPSGKQHHPAFENIMRIMMGIILGGMTRDKALTRSSLKELFKNKSVDQNFLHGFFAVAQMDYSQQGQIDNFAKSIGFESTLVTNILKLQDKKNKQIFGTIIALVKDICPSEFATSMASYFQLVRGDFTHIKTVMSNLEIPKNQQKNVEAVLAVTSQDQDTLEEHLPTLKEMFKVNDSDLIKNIIGLTKGRPGKVVDQLAKEMGLDKAYMRSIYLIIYYGNKLKVENCRPEERQQILFQMQDEIECFSTQCLMKSNLPADTTSKMSKAISLIIQSCWQSERASEQLLEILIEKPGEDTFFTNVKKGKYNNPSQILMQGLRDIGNKLEPDIRQTLRNKKKTLRLLQDEVLPYLFSKTMPSEQKKSGGKVKKGIRKATFIKNMDTIFDDYIQNEDQSKQQKALLNKSTELTLDEMAEIVGCTARYTRTYKINQPFYNCKKCDDCSQICLPCSIITHIKGQSALNEKDKEGTHKFAYCTNQRNKAKMCISVEKGEELQKKQEYRHEWEFFYQKKEPIKEKLDIWIENEIVKREDFINQISLNEGVNLGQYCKKDSLSTFYERPKEENKEDAEKQKQDQTKAQTLLDTRYGRSYSLLESIVLLSSGILTQHMKLLIVKNGNLDSQQTVILDDVESRKYYVGFLDFIQILAVRRDFELFQSVVPQIKGEFEDQQKKFPDSMFETLFFLTKGGSTPTKARPYDPLLLQKNRKFYFNKYLEFFMLHFKDDWRKIAALHKSILINPQLAEPMYTQENSQQNKYHQFIIEELFKEQFGFNQKQITIMGTISYTMDGELYYFDKIYKYLKLSVESQRKVECALSDTWGLHTHCKSYFNCEESFKEFLQYLRYAQIETQMDKIMVRLFEQFLHTDVVLQKGAIQIAYDRSFKKENEKKLADKEMIKIGLYQEQVELYMKQLIKCMNGSTGISLDKFINYFSAIESVRANSKLPANPFLAQDYSIFAMHKKRQEDKDEYKIDEETLEKWKAKNGTPTSVRMLTVIVCEGIQILNHKSTEFFSSFYNKHALQQNNWKDTLTIRIIKLRETILSSKPNIDNDTNSIFRILNESKDLNEQQIYLCKATLSAINECDINQAARVADILSNNSSFKYLRSMIASFTDIDKNDNAVSVLQKKRELNRLFQYSINKQFKDRKTDVEIQQALIKIIARDQLPNLFGVCITDLRDIQMTYIRHYVDINKIFMIQNESGEQFDLDQLVNILYDQGRYYNNLRSILPFCIQRNIQKPLKSGKILQALIDNAKKLPLVQHLISDFNQDFLKSTIIAKKIKQAFDQQELKISDEGINLLKKALNKDIVMVVIEGIFSKEGIQDKDAKLKELFEKVIKEFAPEEALSYDLKSKQALLEVLLEIVKSFTETLKQQVDEKICFNFIIKVFNCFSSKENDSWPIVELIDNLLLPLIDFSPDLQESIKLMKLLAAKEPLNALEHLPGLLRLTLTQLKEADAIELDDEAIPKLINFIQMWMKVVVLAISLGNQKQTVQEKDKAIISSLTQAFDSTTTFVESLKLGEDVATQLKRVKILKTALTGIIHLCQGNYEGLESLASLLGGVPEKEGFQRLKQAIQVVQNNKEGISFTTAKQIASANVDLALKAIPIQIPGIEKIEALIQKGMDNPASLIDPKTFFDIFKNEKNVIGMEEFKNIFVQLGINMPHAMVLQIFSVADIEKKGELSYHEFAKALLEIKQQLIQKFMVDLGFSVREIVLSLTFTIFMLILQFVFIFIGMAAFSPTTTFSSVINSILAVGSSFGAKGKDKNEDKKPDEIKEMGNQSELSAV